MNLKVPLAPSAPPPFADAAQDLARRLDHVLDTLLLLIAARFRVLGGVTVPFWNRVSRVRQRLAFRLARLIVAASRGGGRVARASGASRPGRPGGRPLAGLPRGRGWLVAVLGNEAACVAGVLGAVLRDPAVGEVLTLPTIARALRPICHVLGVALPAVLQPKPAVPRAARASVPPREPGEPPAVAAPIPSRTAPGPPISAFRIA